LKDKLSNKEAISMPDFATDFKYLSESDADMAFKSLLSKSIIPRARQAAALNNYEVWKRNEGQTFWASQSHQALPRCRLGRCIIVLGWKPICSR
jgi:hypothetical protein